MQQNNLTQQPHITKTEAKRKIESMNLINGFLFDSVLEDKKDAIIITQKILEATFNRPITVSDITSQKTYNGVDTYLHGIRFDAHITPESDGSITATIYDVEMEDRNADRQELPKRLRYYTALSDDKHVKAGQNYISLPDFVTITISSYDPFEAGDMYYEARTVLTTHPGIEYNDGVLHIFLYCKGRLNDGFNESHGKKLTEMLKYILSGEKPLTPNSDIEDMDKIVTQVKKKPEVTINYMRQWDRELHIRREAAQEATQETKSEDGLIMIRFARNHHISDDETRLQLANELHLKPETIDELFKQANAEKEPVATEFQVSV